MYFARCVVAIAALLVPTVASAEVRHHSRLHRTARVQKAQKTETGQKHLCEKAPVEIVAGGPRGETATFALAKCDGTPSPRAVDELSILARPASAPRPRQALESLARTHGAELAPGIRRIDARLVERLDLVVDHFRKAGQPSRVLLVSGYRPRSAGSFHSSGRALDFRIDGVANEAVLDFCKSLADTGCGYYPNSVFVHMDVREPGAGHVSWVDVSRPGEEPKYVSSWPLRMGDSGALPALPVASTAMAGSAGEAEKQKEPMVKRDVHPYFF